MLIKTAKGALDETVSTHCKGSEVVNERARVLKKLIGYFTFVAEFDGLSALFSSNVCFDRTD